MTDRMTADVAALIERLHERAAKMATAGNAAALREAAAALAAQQDELTRARADAERYRWLKPHFRTFSLDMGGQHSYCLRGSMNCRGPSLDAAIRALAQEKPHD